MSISPLALYPPNPSTTRAQSVHISYDDVNDRIAYPTGKSVFIRSVDIESVLKPKQFSKHIHTITAVTFAPSGNYVASADESGALKIWDSSVIGEDATKISFEQPSIKSEFSVLSGPIKSIAWDSDSSRVIAVGQGKDKFGHCFSWDSGNSIGEIQGHSATVNAVDIKSQRPYRAATVGEDKALVFYNGPPFKFDKSIRGHHTNSIKAVKFSPDGKWLVSVGSDRAIVIYDGKTGEYIKKLENAHKGGIYSVSWFKDSSKFVTASADNSIKQWNIDSLESTAEYNFTSSNSVDNQQVGVVVTKAYIISLSLNGNLNYFKEGESTPFAIILGHKSPLTSILLNKQTLYTGASEGPILKWSIDCERINTIADRVGEHSNYVVGISAEDSHVVSADWDDKLNLWKNDELAKSVSLKGQPKQIGAVSKKIVVLFESSVEIYTEELERKFEYGLGFQTTGFAAKEDLLLVTNFDSKSVEVLSIDSDGITKSDLKFTPLRSPPNLIRISPDGKFVAVADLTGKYTLYETGSASVVTTRWAFHSSKVNDAKWTSDSQFIISGGLDTGLFLYSVKKPSKVLKFPLAHQIGISGVEWLNYDGKKGSFTTIGLDGVLKVWNVDFSVYL